MYTTILFCKYMYMLKDVIYWYHVYIVPGFGPPVFVLITIGFVGGCGVEDPCIGLYIVFPGPVN